MKIRFADGDKSFDIETDEDMVLLYDENGLQLGFNEATAEDHAEN